MNYKNRINFKNLIFAGMLLFTLAACSKNRGDEPLIKTKWGQNDPYNYFFLAKDSSGKVRRVPTGCGAVVLAQIMNYMQYPSQITTDNRKVDIVWSNSFNVYHRGVLPQRVHFVSALIRYSADLLHTDYTFSRGLSNFRRMFSVMENDLHFSPYLTYFDSGCFEEKSGHLRFMDIIRQEIQEGRPVIIAASNKNAGRHFFLLDGIKGDSIHVNFGWGGEKDGYYDFDHIPVYNYRKSIIVGVADSNYVPHQTIIKLSKMGTLRYRLKENAIPYVYHLKVEGPLNNEDIAYIRYMGGHKGYDNKLTGVLRSLDLSKAQIKSLPAFAFARTGLQYVILPENMKGKLHSAFKSCPILMRVDYR